MAILFLPTVHCPKNNLQIASLILQSPLQMWLFFSYLHCPKNNLQKASLIIQISLQLWLFFSYLHCPKNNLSLRFMNRACHSWNGCNGICLAFVCFHLAQYTVGSAPTVTGPVFMRRFLGLWSRVYYTVALQYSLRKLFTNGCKHVPLCKLYSQLI